MRGEKEGMTGEGCVSGSERERGELEEGRCVGGCCLTREGSERRWIQSSAV